MKSILLNLGYNSANARDVCHCNNACDIVGVLAAASKAVQRTQSLPWERHADQQQVVETIRRMTVALVAKHKKPPSTDDLLCLAGEDQLWPRLSTMERQFRQQR